MAGLKAVLGSATMIGTVAIVAQPAQAGWFTDWFKDKPLENIYELCGERLSAAKVESELAAKACAEVLHPQDLGTCVQDISVRNLDVLATLSACRRVRRPLELATCVEDIHQHTSQANLTTLEACRRSLLPERYGKCVVGLGKSLDVTLAPGLNTCIDASDRPADILSSFIPVEELPRMEGFGSKDASLPTISSTPTSSSSFSPTATDVMVPTEGGSQSPTTPDSQVPAVGAPQLY